MAKIQIILVFLIPDLTRFKKIGANKNVRSKLNLKSNFQITFSFFKKRFVSRLCNPPPWLAALHLASLEIFKEVQSFILDTGRPNKHDSYKHDLQIVLISLIYI